MGNSEIRIYYIKDVVTFRKTKEPFGGLSNMASGFPLKVNNIKIRTSEALYQSCRFPDYPNIQKEIIMQNSPMTAKMISKRERSKTRADWDTVYIRVMKWCLRVKLAQNWNSFSQLLLKTNDHPIVEISRKDDFWGCKIQDDDILVGVNALGRLLMELRDLIKTRNKNELLNVEPLRIDNFILLGDKIREIH